MLGTVLPSTSDRKRRLFAVACCRRVEDWLIGDLAPDSRDEAYRKAVKTAERFADGKATSEELSEAFYDADDSTYCNEYLEELTSEERRKACIGDDAGWADRLNLSDEERREMEAHPDPIAWFESNEVDQKLPAAVDPFRDVAKEDAVLIGETTYRKVLLLVRHYDGEERAAEERKVQAALVRDIFGDSFPPPAFDPSWQTPDVAAIARGIYEDRSFDRMPILADALEEAGCDNPAILGHCRGPGPHVRGCWALDLVLGKD